MKYLGTGVCSPLSHSTGEKAQVHLFLHNARVSVTLPIIETVAEMHRV